MYRKIMAVSLFLFSGMYCMDVPPEHAVHFKEKDQNVRILNRYSHSIKVTYQMAGNPQPIQIIVDTYNGFTIPQAGSSV